jgi:hypothetical protein
MITIAAIGFLIMLSIVGWFVLTCKNASSKHDSAGVDVDSDLDDDNTGWGDDAPDETEMAEMV